jgi:hypothetical protein
MHGRAPSLASSTCGCYKDGILIKHMGWTSFQTLLDEGSNIDECAMKAPHQHDYRNQERMDGFITPGSQDKAQGSCKPVTTVHLVCQCSIVHDQQQVIS